MSKNTDISVNDFICSICKKPVLHCECKKNKKKEINSRCVGWICFKCGRMYDLPLSKCKCKKTVILNVEDTSTIS